MSTPPAPQADHADPHPDTSPTPTTAQLARSVIASLIGIVAYFVPFTVAGTRSIPLDHIVTLDPPDHPRGRPVCLCRG